VNQLHVLGTPLLVTDYDGLAGQCLAWARGPRCIAMDFANTQIVTLRRHDPSFRELTSAYDCFPPDGMPLIWCLNRAGARLRDRVYGPAFMERFLSSVPEGYTHYLLGGSEKCGARLRQIFGQRNPNLNVVGAFHGKCQTDGILEGAAEEQVLADIARLSPDFLWVGFGTPKQQAWVKRHKQMIQRGVILTVGFAFDVNAGLKPDAPPWMQRLGLTWVYRLATEPRRLGPRYLKYNSLFLWYLLWDGLRGRAWGQWLNDSGL
jgi:N-acetylglucosaminyldiphosphoundecaprenol N-acetyl-beta-D-mannosaminyltransferase